MGTAKKMSIYLVRLGLFLSDFLPFFSELFFFIILWKVIPNELGVMSRCTYILLFFISIYFFIFMSPLGKYYFTLSQMYCFIPILCGCPDVDANVLFPRRLIFLIGP